MGMLDADWYTSHDKDDPLLGQRDDKTDHTKINGYGQMTQASLTNKRISGYQTTGSGDDISYQPIYTYDSPQGPVTDNGNGSYITHEKMWWNNDLAEPMVFRFGEDGKVEGQPYDSKQSMGEQLGSFATSVGKLAVAGGVAYGAAAATGAAGIGGSGTAAGAEGAAGAAAGTEAGAGAVGTAASEEAALAAAENGIMGSTAGSTGGAANSIMPAAGAAAEGGAGAAAVGAGANAAQQAASNGSVLDKVGQAWDKYGDKAVDFAAAAYTADRQRETARENREYLSGLTPNRGFYEDKQKQAWEDPTSFFDSKEYQLGLDKVHNQLSRRDAAGGGLANSTQRQVLMQQHSLGAMRDYRNDLGNVTTSNRNTAAGVASPMMQTNKDENNANRAVLDTVGQALKDDKK